MRADWRFLMPWSAERAPIIRLAPRRCAPWMVSDGWAQPEGGDDGQRSADVVAVGTGAELAAVLGQAEPPERLVVLGDGFDLRALLKPWPPRRPVSLPTRYRTRHYLAVPPTSQPKTYLPLGPEAAGLQRWLAARLPGPLRWSAPGLAWVVIHAQPLLPAVVTIAVDRSVDRSADRDRGSDGLGPPLLVTTSGHDEGSRVVVLPLDHDGRPTRVDKLANRPCYDANNSGEQEALRVARLAVSPAIAAAVPQPLGAARRAGTLVVSESYIDGPTMAQALGRRTPRRRAADELRRAVSWLVAVHQATARPLVWGPGHGERLLYQPLTAIEQAIGADLPEVRALVRHVNDAADGGRAAVALRHYDPGPWNLIMGTRLGVIDWEQRSPRPDDRRGLAGADLHYLLTYWRHLVTGARSLDDEKAASGLVPTSNSRRRWASTVSRKVAGDAFEAMGLDRRVAPAVWVHNWLEQAWFTTLRRPDAQPGRSLDYLRWAAAAPNAVGRLG